ncbi:hypothetical protein FOA52_001505 [Chlamydomonas sp. UWO 241]|nr:hypothetical protein FOA52_001505 [Chlamydomonas sp. UWO 241]
MPAGDDDTEEIAELLRARLGLGGKAGTEEERLLSSPDLAGIAELIITGRAKNIICMCGAGISVSAGIPDFRTPGTGLFSKLEKYNVSTPEQLFHIDYFRRDPQPFHVLAKELFPGQFQATPTHCLMRLLHDKGLLLRCYTQNIDSLESVAGLPNTATVAAHGNFDAATCTDCRRPYSTEFFKAAVDANKICRCEECEGLVKPDIVFYGEDLPARFFQLLKTDFPSCDLLIVLGTSLIVHPFAGLIHRVGPKVPRLLINRELVGNFDPLQRPDALVLGDCDAAAASLAAMLGWEVELQVLVDAQTAAKQKGQAQAQAQAKQEGRAQAQVQVQAQAQEQAQEQVQVQTQAQVQAQVRAQAQAREQEPEGQAAGNQDETVQAQELEGQAQAKAQEPEGQAHALVQAKQEVQAQAAVPEGQVKDGGGEDGGDGGGEREGGGKA